MRWSQFRKRSRCPHIHVRGIYGDEIFRAHGLRNECMDCGKLLDGPVLLSVLRKAEATVIDTNRSGGLPSVPPRPEPMVRISP